jgi:hypothetical protein
MFQLIDTTVKAPQKTVFFDHYLYPSVERLINGVSTEYDCGNL